MYLRVLESLILSKALKDQAHVCSLSALDAETRGQSFVEGNLGYVSHYHAT